MTRFRPACAALALVLACLFSVAPVRASQQPSAPAPAPAAQPQAPSKKAEPPPPPLPGKRMEIVIPPENAIPAPAALKGVFPKGFPPGLGYGLAFVTRQSDGSMLLYGLTGRGPTLPGPQVPQAAGEAALPSALFAAPDYPPSLTALRLTEKSAEVVGIWPLRLPGGQPARGVPPSPKDVQGLKEIPLGLNLARLPFDERGLFPKGVAKDGQLGCLWVYEDYGPSLLKVSTGDGRILKKYDPGEGLMELPSGFKADKGFSGVCASDSGKLYACMRGVLDVGGVSAFFSRIAEFDPENERVRHFAYPVDKDAYLSAADAQVSDITYVSENRFLVLEQGPAKDGGWRAMVYMVDITKATNIRRAVNDQGQPVEVVADAKEWESLGLRMARKVLVADLVASGMTGERPHCLTLLPGQLTLAVMSGGGFGMQPAVDNPAKDASGKPADKPGDYLLDSRPGLSLGQAQTQAKVTARQDHGGSGAWLWLFTLHKKPTDYKVTWEGGLPSGPPAAPAAPPAAPPAAGH